MTRDTIFPCAIIIHSGKKKEYHQDEFCAFQEHWRKQNSPFSSNIAAPKYYAKFYRE